MINWNGIIIKTKDELEKAIITLPEASKQALRNEFDGYSNTTLTAEEKDKLKYLKRASVKDTIIAEMATENMSRVRSGKWTVPDLVSLTQDPMLKLILDDINTLSFELAVLKLQTINNPLITKEIKEEWIRKLQTHFYN
jgi:hypothetical protein